MSDSQTHVGSLAAGEVEPRRASSMPAPTAAGRAGFGLVVEAPELRAGPLPAKTAGRWRRALAGDNRGFVLRRWLAVSDLAALILAWIASLALATTFDRTPTVIDSVVFVALLPAWMAIANALGLYHLPDRRLGHSLADEIGPIILALTLWSWAFLLGRAVVDTNSVELLPSVGLWAFAIVNRRGAARGDPCGVPAPPVVPAAGRGDGDARGRAEGDQAPGAPPGARARRHVRGQDQRRRGELRRARRPRPATRSRPSTWRRRWSGRRGGRRCTGSWSRAHRATSTSAAS